MQGLTGVFSLRGQIAAQEKRNVDLAASNTSLRKANADLSTERKEFSLTDDLGDLVGSFSVGA